MAKRSTAAVDVADGSDGAAGKDGSPTSGTEQATADGAAVRDGDGGADGAAGTARASGSPARSAEGETGRAAGGTASEPPAAPELHSSHRLARRYCLEECVTRLDGFSSWRAVDEKLRRAVGIHVLPAGHPRSRAALAAARSAALLGDPRFVQVLDAVEENGLVHIVHEWLPDAVPLTTLLAAGPLETYEAYQLATHVSQAMAAAHREGLAHLRLTPGSVLRTASGQYRIRGLAVDAALRGVSSDRPQRTDTEAIGALLYASLTQRWPYEEDAYGLKGMAELAGGSLVPPDQVRAGVHRGLSELAMRALVNNGATASRQEQPCTMPEELVEAIAVLPRIRPPEPDFTVPAPYRRPTPGRNAYGDVYATAVRAPAGPAAPAGMPAGAAVTPPTLPGRTGKALKWGVCALLIAALGLGSWQVADALMAETTTAAAPPSPSRMQVEPAVDPTGRPVPVLSVSDFDPLGDGAENGDEAPAVLDDDSATFWKTDYYRSAQFGNLKAGVGLVLDLGEPRQVSSVTVDLVGETSVDFLAAASDAASMPASLEGFSRVAGGSGTEVTLRAQQPIRTQYVMVWLTELPPTEDGNYRGRITGVQVRS